MGNDVSVIKRDVSNRISPDVAAVAPSASAFRLGELPDDLLGEEIVNHLDPPSRLSVSMTTRSLRIRIWRLYDNIKNSYRVLEAAAYRGYTVWLKWAHANGAPIVEAVVEAAFKGNHLELAQWLLAVCPEELTGPQLNSCMLAGYLNGNRALANIVIEKARRTKGLGVFGLTQLKRDQVAIGAAARGGHLKLAQELVDLLENSSSFRYEDIILMEGLAEGGHLQELKLLVQKASKARQAILEAACNGGHLNIIQYVYGDLEYQGLPSMRSVLQSNVIKHPEILSYLSAKFPESFSGSSIPIASMHYLVAEACRIPSLSLFEWLRDQKIDMIAGSLELLFGGQNDIGRDEEVAFGATDEPSPSDRFECIKFVYENGKQWDFDKIRFTPLWASLDQIKWIVAQTSSTSTSADTPAVPFNSETLTSYLQTRSCAKIPIVKYILEQGGIVSVKSLVESAFMDNNLALIDFFFSVASTKEGLEDALKVDLSLVLENVIMVFSDLHPSREKVLKKVAGILQSGQDTGRNVAYTMMPVKKRKRFHNFISLLRLFTMKGISFEPSLVSLLTKSGDGYFQKELSSLLSV